MTMDAVPVRFRAPPPSQQPYHYPWYPAVSEVSPSEYNTHRPCSRFADVHLTPSKSPVSKRDPRRWLLSSIGHVYNWKISSEVYSWQDGFCTTSLPSPRDQGSLLVKFLSSSKTKSLSLLWVRLMILLISSLQSRNPKKSDEEERCSSRVEKTKAKHFLNGTERYKKFSNNELRVLSWDETALLFVFCRYQIPYGILISLVWVNILTLRLLLFVGSWPPNRPIGKRRCIGVQFGHKIWPQNWPIV